MAKSRKNKDRKEQLNKFKKITKSKNMEVPKFKPFRQVPHWEPDAKIEITGSQFGLLQDFFHVFAEPIRVMQDVFSTNLNKGVINIKYVDNDNKEVPKEDVEAYMKEVTEYLKTQAKATSPEAVIAESKVEAEETPQIEEVAIADTAETPKKKLKPNLKSV